MQLQGLTLSLRHIHMSAMHAHSAAGPTKLLCRSGLCLSGSIGSRRRWLSNRRALLWGQVREYDRGPVSVL